MWKLLPHQLDIDNAYANAPLEEEIYLKAPERLRNVEPGKVLKFNKALYGLPQSGRCWNKNLHETLSEYGLQRLCKDYGLYRMSLEKVILLIAIYVDDIYIAASTIAIKDQFIEYL